jgi:hypothetical protein
MKSILSSHPRAMRREEYTPWQYAYSSSAVIITGLYGG